MARKKERPPRRKPGTGSIRYKKARALPYEAAFPLGHGQYRYDYFATRAEAEAHLDRLCAERDSTDRPRNIAGGSRRLDRFLTDWLAAKRPHVKAKTLEHYAYLCDLAIGFFGGDVRIDAISREDADRCYAYFHARGFKDVPQMRMVLAQAFRYAEDEEYIRRNPFERAKAPPVVRRRRVALTKAQRASMLDHAAGDRLEVLWHLYSRMGLRRGEGIGLLWANIDWREKTITIMQQYTTVGSKTVQSTPKTPRSTRTFPVPDDIIDRLRALQVQQIECAAATADWRMLGLVFTDGHGERLTVDHVRWRWTQLKKRAGIPLHVTIHDLRHTALYHMEQVGIPESVRMAFAGHSTAAMAKKYADHATDDMDALRAAVEKMG